VSEEKEDEGGVVSVVPVLWRGQGLKKGNCAQVYRGVFFCLRRDAKGTSKYYNSNRVRGSRK